MWNCINALKITIIKNKKGFIIKNNNKNLEIIKSFLKLNIIKFVKIDNKNNNIVCYVNYINDKPVFKNIINMMKPSKKNFITAKNLKKISYKKNFILILSTNKGLINSIEATNLNVGGLLIAMLWN